VSVVRRYVDITHDSHDGETAAKLDALAPLMHELADHGMLPLCLIASGPSSPMCWSVVVDGSGETAASVTVADGRQSVYVASRLADGTILETQWRPGLRVFMRVGPALLLDDGPARRLGKLTRRSVGETLAVHADRLRDHGARSPAIPWTAAEYLRFRRASGSLIEMNTKVAEIVGALFLFSTLGGVGLALVVRWQGWIFTGVVVVALALVTELAFSGLGTWIGRAVAKRTPLRARERLAHAWRMSGEDDER